MDEVLDGTFKDEPPSTQPSQAPPPVVVKQNFPDAPQVATPQKPKVQSTHADRFTSDRDVRNGAFPNSNAKNTVKEVQQRIVSVRAKFFKNYLNESLSTLAKLIIIKVREADPSMSLLPIENSTNDEIDNEESFPDDDDGAKKYMSSLFQNNWVKKFTLRFKVMKTLTCVRNFVIPYMSETKNYATVDLLSAGKICCIGFFSTLHPDLHNRDKLRRICETHVLATRGRAVNLSVLPRGITHGKREEVAESRVIVIDVATSDAQIVSDALMEKTFFEYDENCRFIPFLRTKKNYSSTLAAIITNHSNLMNDTQRINVPDLNFTADVNFTTDLKSIKAILMSANDNEAPLLHDVDIAPNGSTNLMYYIEQDSELESFLRGLNTLLSKNIDPKDLPKVYKNSVPVDKVLNQRRVTNNERKFWDEMEKSLGLNPQDPEAAPIKPAQSKLNYAAAAKANHTSKPTVSVLPQDKRLINMETSVNNIQKSYMTKSDVEELIKQHSTQSNIIDPALEPEAVNRMIDAKLNTFQQSLPTPTAPIPEHDLIALIEKTTTKSIESLQNSTQVQSMIDESIAKFKIELSTTHEKLAKAILAVTDTTTNLGKSIAALQTQTKDLSDLILEKSFSPASSPLNEAGAKI